MARKIAVDIVINDRNVAKKFDQAGRSAKGFASSIGQLRLSIGSLVKSELIIEGVDKALEALHATVHAGIHEFSEHAHVSAQTAAALKSTGGVANVTAEQIDKLGLSLSNLSGVNDEVIQGGENVLLAFQNIRDFSGKGNQIFTDATKASLDFAVRSGRSVQAASVAVGRALQDPAKAAGSLRRAYVVLTSAEKAAIASAVKHGDMLKAQRLIISDLNKRYGGAAEAAGKTLPGALSVLRERFADLAGKGIGRVAPALTSAALSLAGFVRKLSEATSNKVRLHIVASGLETLGKDLLRLYEGEIRRAGKLIRGSVGPAEELARAVGDRIRSINWRERISEAGKAVGDGFVFLLEHLQDAIKRVNWNKVGQEIVRGIGLAIGAVAVFLASVNWSKVTHVLVNTLGTALKAVGALLVGVGEELGRAVLSGIEAGLSRAGAAMERLAVKIVLKIIEPFTHLPSFLGGGPFQEMKDSLNATLGQMAQDGAVGGQNIGAAVAAGIKAGVGPSSGPLRSGAKAAATKAAKEAGASALPPPPDPTGGKQLQGITAGQRNTFFDNSISRLLLRGGLGDLQKQLAAIQKASALITKRIAATKDITRKLNLEDQLLQLQAQASSIRASIADAAASAASDAKQKVQDATQALLDSLDFGVTKAQATARLSDDLGALKALQAGIKERIKVEGATLALRQKLFDTQQQIKQTKTDALTAKQFGQLGLTASGDERTPGVANLRKRLSQLTGNIAGTSLDTPKLQAQLARFRKVLSEGLVPKDVRAKIKSMFDDIADQLKRSGNQTKFRHVSSTAVLAGLGLDPDQIRALRGRIASVGVGGTIPPGHSAAFAGAGAGGDVYLDGAKVGKVVTRHQQKSAKRRSVPRRGPYAGLH